MKKFLSAVAIVVVLNGPAQAQDWSKAVAAYNDGDYATALQEFSLLAEQGDAVAQHELGLMYANGEGVLQDHSKAVRWYRLSAEQGDIDAQYSLGLMYSEGLGVTVDYVAAHMWYNLAYLGGHEPAWFSRNDLSKEMTHQDITTAQAMARECMDNNFKNCGY